MMSEFLIETILILSFSEFSMGNNEMKEKTYTQAEVDTLLKNWFEEKQCLMRVISTYGMLAESIPEHTKEINHIKPLLKQESPLPLNSIEKSIKRLRKEILAKELAGTTSLSLGDEQGETDALTTQITEILRMLRRVIYFFLEGFYPLEESLEKKASTIHIDVNSDVAMNVIGQQVEAFTEYSVALKQKIFSDFMAVNETFLDLLKQVQMIEKITQDEFNTDVRVKAFQNFEDTIGEEMGAITRAFEFKQNIHELKTAVFKKLGNIKKIIARKKQVEVDQLKRANAKINQLKKKVADVQADARKMFVKAETFQQAALFDGLTEVHNRKSFEMQLNKSLARISEGGEFLALIMIDVNRFKWINDTFGHVAGDKVLKAIADSLKANFRKSDFVARYGGDEFVVLVDGLDADNVQAGIQRFKTRLKAIKFISHTLKTNIKVEISAGLAMAKPGDSGAALLHRADQAMYEDKKNNTSSSLDTAKA